MIVCPWCGKSPCLPIRVGDRCREFLCEFCRMRHTRKAGQLGETYAFWPPDIDRAFNHKSTIKPLFK
jgi:hypothetical protein